MRVTKEMVDPELRTAGSISRFIMRPTKRAFRVLHWLMSRSIGTDVEGLRCGERRIPSLDEGVDVRVRIYESPSHDADARVPGVLFLHGGGYAMGRPDMQGDAYKALIEKRECVVVAPDYRKTLEEPYPAAANDCYGTLVWMKENAAELGIRDDQLIVMGQSAGGGLTAAVSLMARDRGEVQIAYQLPLYPMIDDRNNSGSAKDNNAPIWNEKHNRLGWDLYLGGLSGDDVSKYAAPARETDYANLPPTATFVGALDPFRDETMAYVENLRAAGVPVEFRIFEGAYHGFEGIVSGAKVSRDANAFFYEHFAKAVDSHFATQA